MSLCGRRQCGGDKGRCCAATWTKTERVEEVSVAVGDRGSGGGMRQTVTDVDAGCDLDQAPGRAVGYREVHCCCA
jgi:hypothetical protein